jgi:hypothetical protein
MFGGEAAVAPVGMVKAKCVGNFGKYAVVQVMFYDIASNWDRSKPDRDLVFGSFRFDPAFEYDETAANSAGFFERIGIRAVGGMLSGLIVGGIVVAWGYIAKKTKEPQKAEPEGAQDN